MRHTHQKNVHIYAALAGAVYPLLVPSISI